MPRSLRRAVPSSVLVTPGISFTASSSVLRLNVHTSSTVTELSVSIEVSRFADDGDVGLQPAELEDVVLGEGDAAAAHD